MKKTALLMILLVATGYITQAAAAGDAAAGKEKSQVCQSCHGADGNSTSSQFPRLAGQYADYIVRALTDYQSGARKNPIMSGFAAPLTEQDRENLAAYFSSQQSLIAPDVGHLEK